MTPFEIRLELLKLSKDMLEQEYMSKREVAHNNWQVASENARTQGQQLPTQPEYSLFPSEQEAYEFFQIEWYPEVYTMGLSKPLLNETNNIQNNG